LQHEALQACSGVMPGFVVPLTGVVRVRVRVLILIRRPAATGGSRAASCNRPQWTDM